MNAMDILIAALTVVGFIGAVALGRAAATAVTNLSHRSLDDATRVYRDTMAAHDRELVASYTK